MKVYCADGGAGLPLIYNWIKDENMKVYCAEMRQFDLIFKQRPNIPKFYILFSFYKSQTIDPYLPFMKELIIDSGAFSLQKQKVSESKVMKYFNDYKKFIERNTEYSFINGFFELDIPRQIGYDNVKEIRNELFEVSDKIIPVWHKEYGLEEFKKMVNDYDYIGVSGVSNRNIKKQSYGKFVRYCHKHNCKIHGLGLLSKTVLNNVPFDSVDGTSWLKTVRYAQYDDKKVNSQYVHDHQYELTYVNLLEHIKMQEDYYKRWKHYHND